MHSESAPGASSPTLPTSLPLPGTRQWEQLDDSTAAAWGSEDRFSGYEPAESKTEASSGRREVPGVLRSPILPQRQPASLGCLSPP